MFEGGVIVILTMVALCQPSYYWCDIDFTSITLVHTFWVEQRL